MRQVSHDGLLLTQFTDLTRDILWLPCELVMCDLCTKLFKQLENPDQHCVDSHNSSTGEFIRISRAYRKTIIDHIHIFKGHDIPDARISKVCRSLANIIEDVH